MRVRRLLNKSEKTYIEAPPPSHLRRKGTSDDGPNDARDAKNGASQASEKGALLEACYLTQYRHHCHEDGTGSCSLDSSSRDKSPHSWCHGADQASDFKEGDYGYGNIF